MGTADTDGDAIEVEREDGIATVWLNRPDTLNAVNLDLLEELHGALVALNEDPEGGLVIAGRGRATCAGMDTDLVGDPDYYEKYADDIDRLNAGIEEALLAHPRPTAIAAHGALIGEPVVFSMYCDFFIAGEETNISLPEIKYGISVADTIEPLADIVGSRNAREIAMRGEAIEPERAREMGLVNRVVPDEEVVETTQAFVADMADYEGWIMEELAAASRPEQTE